MPGQLQILCAENAPANVLLIEDYLRQAGFEPITGCVETAAAFAAALREHEWDAVLIQNSLPDFSVDEALELLRASGQELPFILAGGAPDRTITLPGLRTGAQAHRNRRQARAAQQQLQDAFQVLLAGNPLPMRIYDQETLGFLEVNDAATEKYGYGRDEFLAMTIKDIRPPDEARKLDLLLEQPRERQQRSGPWVHRKKDGTLIEVEIVSHDIVFAQRPARLVLANDITERRQAETAMRQSEERYRIVSELASDFAYAVRVEPDGRLVAEWGTEAFKRVTGYTVAEVDLAGGWPNILHPDDIPAFLQRAQRLLSGQPDLSEYRTLTKSGQVRWLRDSGRPEWDEAHQRVIRIYGAARDITERKQAEEAVGRSERRFRALIENGSDGIALVAANGTVLYASTATARILGGTPEGWLGGNFLNRVHPEDVPQVSALFAQLLQSPAARFDATFRYRRKDESWCWLEASATNLLAEPGVNAIVANFRDVSERWQAGQELQRRAEQFTLLYQAGLTLNSALDSAAQLQTVFDIAVKTLRASRADFFRYDAAENELRLEVTYRYPDENVPETLRHLRFPLGREQGLVGWVGQQRQSLYLPDVAADPRWISVDPEIRSALWGPV